MASPNINLRDPVLYRIVHAAAPADRRRVVHLPDVRLRPRPVRRDRGGDPLDLHARVRGPPAALRLARSSTCRCRHVPHQYEFARLNLTYTVLSKRVLLRLVNEGHVRGWDDPRMPTISGLRRRGFPAEGIRDFAAMIGVAKADSVIEIGQLEYAVRDVLNRTAPRRFARPGPAQGRDRELPGGPGRDDGRRQQPRGRGRRDARGASSRASCGSSATTSWRSRRRSSSAWRPGARSACGTPTSSPATSVVKDAAGRVVELRCTYDPATRGGDAPDGRRPKATLHWVSAAHAVPAEVRLYDHLFARPDPGRRRRPVRRPQPRLRDGRPRRLLEPALADAGPARRSSSSGWATSARTRTRRRARSVFNRTLTLKDTWAKVQARG